MQNVSATSDKANTTSGKMTGVYTNTEKNI